MILFRAASPPTAAAHARSILHAPLVPQPAVDGNACWKGCLTGELHDKMERSLAAVRRSARSLRHSLLRVCSILGIAVPRLLVIQRCPLPTDLLASPSCAISLSHSMSS